MSPPGTVANDFVQAPQRLFETHHVLRDGLKNHVRQEARHARVIRCTGTQGQDLASLATCVCLLLVTDCQVVEHSIVFRRVRLHARQLVTAPQRVGGAVLDFEGAQTR